MSTKLARTCQQCVPLWNVIARRVYTLPRAGCPVDDGIVAFVTPQAESILELFRSTGAYLQGHFRLTSGLHSPNTCSARWCCNIRRRRKSWGGCWRTPSEIHPRASSDVVSPGFGRPDYRT